MYTCFCKKKKSPVTAAAMKRLLFSKNFISIYQTCAVLMVAQRNTWQHVLYPQIGSSERRKDSVATTSAVDCLKKTCFRNVRWNIKLSLTHLLVM